MFVRRFLHPVRPEYEIVDDSLKGEDVVLVLLLESRSVSRVPHFPQDDEEDGVSD